MRSTPWISFRIKRFIRIAGVAIIGFSSVVHGTESLIFGIHPYRTHEELRQMFTPLALFLSQRMGRSVEVRIGESYEAHLKAIMEGQVDFAYIGPASFVQLSEKKGMPNLLARLETNGKPTFTGKIITREGSDIHTLDDLKGCRFAFGSVSSTMSHLVPRQMLYEAGISVEDFASYHFYNSHDNVALAVLAGDADAGAVKEAVFDKFHAKGLVAIATTPEVPEHLFIAPSTTDPETVRLLRGQLLSLSADNPETSKVLHPIKKTATALVSVKAGDYQQLRGIFTALRIRGVIE
jgi:phosphonate transport system substrate-binding protein